MPHQSTPPLTQTCPICGVEFTRHPHEKPSTFQRRRTCSMECGRIATIRAQTHALPERKCVICDERFARRDGEQTTHFLKRQACSHECQRTLLGPAVRTGKARKRAALIASAPPRACLGCGEPIVCRPGEWIQRFLRRRTCSKRCTGIVFGRNVLIERYGTAESRAYPVEWSLELRDAIRVRDGGVCCACQRPPLANARGRITLHHVHHINLCKADCRPENLITLCPVCHKKAHELRTRDAWQVMLEDIVKEHP